MALSFILSCQSPVQERADLIISAKRIYTLDSAFSYVEAIAIRDGRILATGSLKTLKDTYQAEHEHIDGYIYPGFIDAHSHFYGYGKTLNRVNLKGTRSLEEMLERTVAYAKEHSEPWIQGRGWDNTQWIESGFPNNTKLSLLFPDRPVILRRVDGHAALANAKALEMAGIDIHTKVEGGEIEQRNGMLTGMLIDNAADLVLDIISEPNPEAQIQALLMAQEQCLAAGLTTVTDAGLRSPQILLIDSLQKSGDLLIRTYVMCDPEKDDIAYWLKRGPLHTERMHMGSFKLYADGALGSKGALLKAPYCQHQGHYGFWLNTPEKLDSLCALLHQNGFQVNTHCIGDSANKAMLEIYGNYLKGTNDLRWRIEHAQVVSPVDRQLFARYGVIPSVQPTHATSDMDWAEERLCADRMDGAYAYKSLLGIHGWLPLGTDFPIEDIAPLGTFYAAVYRKDQQGHPRDGFLPQEALSPEEAMRGITIWAAKAGFMEKEVGSLEPHKFADMVVLKEDPLYHNQPFSLEVQATYIQGRKVYQR